MKEILVSIAPILPVLLVVLFFSKKQKPWSELNNKERRDRTVLIIIGVVIFAAGLVVALLY